MKPIEIERRGKWYDLRKSIFEQPHGVKEYEFLTDEHHQAMNAIRQVAKKYRFKVAMSTASGHTEFHTRIFVYKTKG